ncbi:MAG: hypothetical protein NTZ48_02100, partial [Candidatus Omnitrophica bacterium]|nr:hypothetical protein [Candidatus Omnitrophota bacterium]
MRKAQVGTIYESAGTDIQHLVSGLETLLTETELNKIRSMLEGELGDLCLQHLNLQYSDRDKLAYLYAFVTLEDLGVGKDEIEKEISAQGITEAATE